MSHFALGFIKDIVPVSMTFLGSSASGTSSSTPTYSINVGNPGRDRIIAVLAWGNQGAAGGSISSCTIAGQAGTWRAQARRGSLLNGPHDLWTAVVPAVTTGAQTIAPVFTGGSAVTNGVAVFEILDAATEAPAYTSAVDQTTTAAISTTLQVPAEGAALAAISAGNSFSGAVWSGLTERSEDINGGQGGSSASLAFATVQSALAITSTASGGISSGQCLLAASWAPNP